MKLYLAFLNEKISDPAAFRRLCVETKSSHSMAHLRNSAAFRRLCVETLYPRWRITSDFQPPSGGCVLKPVSSFADNAKVGSRLQAAVC